MPDQLFRRSAAVAALLVAALVALPAQTVAAQQVTSPIISQPCTYDTCAVRVEDGWFSRKLIQGTSGQEVARLGFGGPDPVMLLGVNDQARAHAQAYKSRQRTGTTLSLIGSIGSIVTYIMLFDDQSSESRRNTLVAINIGSLVTAYAGRSYLQSARRELDRSVWWFNSEVSQ